MLFKHTDSVHIKAIIKSGEAILGEREKSQLFLEYVIVNFPWVPYTFDSIKWSAVENSITRDISILGVNEVASFVAQTTLGQYKHVAFIYNDEESPLITTIEYAIEHLDVLCKTVTGACYLCGVTIDLSGIPVYTFADFVEWDFDENISLSGIMVTQAMQ